MKTYEAMILLDNREVKNGWETLKGKVDGILTKYGAKILVAKRWDERKLAYEIKKQKRATYYLAYLEADPESIDELSRSLKLTSPILRHIVLRCEEVPAEAYEPEKEFDLESTDDVEETASEESEDGESQDEGGADDSDTSDDAATGEDAPEDAPEAEASDGDASDEATPGGDASGDDDDRQS